MTRLQSLLSSDREVLGRQIAEPKLYVRVGKGELWTDPHRTIIDTGSLVTLVSPAIAREVGVSDEELDQAQRWEFSTPYGWARLVLLDLDMHERFVPQAGSGLILKAVRVFVPVTEMNENVILGQHDTLERFEFEQRNFDPFHDFRVRLNELDPSLSGTSASRSR